MHLDVESLRVVVSIMYALRKNGHPSSRARSAALENVVGKHAKQRKVSMRTATTARGQFPHLWPLQPNEIRGATALASPRKITKISYAGSKLGKGGAAKIRKAKQAMGRKTGRKAVMSRARAAK